ncbi:MAG TPA: ergothioneine biosynthesis protein EgtB [Acetobacteraceae bacterium]|jgi:ergothioneine biosynthesis protein EgtB|nr:ergothioneine biosynthesis protein EgtB [Acetobacteraceae bacterium]
MDVAALRADLPTGSHDMARRFAAVRAYTEQLAAALTAEDQCIQSMPDASPAKWHRAHTTWFFEQFVLQTFAPDYRVFDPAFGYLFNSYYEAVGARHPRPMRGMLTRPPNQDVTRYRAYVDDAIMRLLPHINADAAALIELGLNHEQQHQELLLTDMLHAFAQNPLAPPVLPDWQAPAGAASPTRFVGFDGGIARIGYQGNGFCFDNETPAHRALLHDYMMATRLVRSSEWVDFVTDGGYRTATLWMSDGWAQVQAQGWSAPLYWEERDGAWWQMGLGGLRALDPDAPVRHISWYEADAFARWADARLPSEAEWEAASGHPDIYETSGHVWQWTASAYSPYPGYRPAPGAVGEYNGKFMVNQMVLRGGSLATPAGHTRPSYRNFFHPDKRWQFSGLRLARDA